MHSLVVLLDANGDRATNTAVVVGRPTAIAESLCDRLAAKLGDVVGAKLVVAYTQVAGGAICCIETRCGNPEHDFAIAYVCNAENPELMAACLERVGTGSDLIKQMLGVK